MKLDGAQVIAADRQTVWAAINDPEILKDCIPGCQSMERTSPTEFAATVKQKVGPVSATFNGEVSLEDVVEGQSLRLVGEGKGGVAGMAKGAATVTLSDVEGGTELRYDVDASVAGKLAQLGSRLIDGVAARLADQFFERFRTRIEGSGDIVGNGAPAAGADAHDGTSGAQAGAMLNTAIGTGAASAVAAGGAAVARGLEPVQAPDASVGAGSGPIDYDDPDIGDIDVSSVEGGPVGADDIWQAAHDVATHGAGAAISGAQTEIEGVHAAATEARAHAEAAADTALSGGAETVGIATAELEAASDAVNRAETRAEEALDAIHSAGSDVADSARREVEGVHASATQARADVESALETARESMQADPAQPGDSGGVGAGTLGAAAGVAAATVGGLAAKASGALDDLHETARERAIAAGKDIDQGAAWSSAKEYGERAADEAGDALEDAVDAVKARVSGAKDEAREEWREAKENAGEALDAAKGAATETWKAGKGIAAEEAARPTPGPMGQPWYVWIIGAVLGLLLVWFVF